jgi:hypothetical protein
MILPFSFVLLAVLAVVPSPIDEGSGWSSATTTKAIAAVKRTSVRHIDATVRSRQSFEAWLISLTGSRSKIAWEVNDCGEATGSAADSERDLPVCVEARGRLSSEHEIVVWVAVGTRRKGLTATRELFLATLTDGKGSDRDAKNLSELASWRPAK